jgi:hypothetical protein
MRYEECRLLECDAVWLLLDRTDVSEERIPPSWGWNSELGTALGVTSNYSY